MGTEPSDIASRLKLVREKLGVSQRDIASLLGVSQSGWQSYETGKSTPGGQVLSQLVDNSGVSGTWLLTGDGEAFPLQNRDSGQMGIGAEEAAHRKHLLLLSQKGIDDGPNAVLRLLLSAEPLGMSHSQLFAETTQMSEVDLTYDLAVLKSNGLIRLTEQGYALSRAIVRQKSRTIPGIAELASRCSSDIILRAKGLEKDRKNNYLGRVVVRVNAEYVTEFISKIKSSVSNVVEDYEVCGGDEVCSITLGVGLD